MTFRPPVWRASDVQLKRVTKNPVSGFRLFRAVALVWFQIGQGSAWISRQQMAGEQVNSTSAKKGEDAYLAVAVHRAERSGHRLIFVGPWNPPACQARGKRSFIFCHLYCITITNRNNLTLSCSALNLGWK
jgi:hypothetical protein